MTSTVSNHTHSNPRYINTIIYSNNYKFVKWPVVFQNVCMQTYGPKDIYTLRNSLQLFDHIKKLYFLQSCFA